MWALPCGSSCNRAMADQIINWKKNEDCFFFYKCNRTSIFVAKIYNCVILNISAPSVYKLHFITYLVLQSDHHHHRAGGRGRAWAGQERDRAWAVRSRGRAWAGQPAFAIGYRAAGGGRGTGRGKNMCAEQRVTEACCAAARLPRMRIRINGAPRNKNVCFKTDQ